MIARLVGRLAVALTRLAHRLGHHAYLSTSCLHDDHGYCQAKTGRVGAKTPAVCKFCDDACVCSCHHQPPRTFDQGVEALSAELDKQKPS